MTIRVIIILAVFFVTSAIGILYLQYKKQQRVKELWVKYFIYMLLVAGMATCLLQLSSIIVFIGLAIVLGGGIELVFHRGKEKTPFWVVIVYCVLCCMFIRFLLAAQAVLFTYVVVVIFDGYSQFFGKLFGRKKLAPSVSPAKTVGGVIGGACLAISTASVLRGIRLPVFLMGMYVIVFALLGDLGASWVKRRLHLKDYSSVIPGHGGILDRFDSFIVAGALVGILNLSRW